MNENRFVSISKFCTLIERSRQYYYINEEKILKIVDYKIKYSIDFLNKSQSQIMHTFFDEETRSKVNDFEKARKILGRKNSLGDVLSAIGVSHPTFLKWVGTKQFKKLGLPVIEKVNLIDISNLEEIKEKLNEKNK